MCSQTVLSEVHGERGNRSVCISTVSAHCWFVELRRTVIVKCRTDPAIVWVPRENCPTSFFWPRSKGSFLYLVAMSEGVVWWIRLKGFKASIFLFGQSPYWIFQAPPIKGETGVVCSVSQLLCRKVNGCNKGGRWELAYMKCAPVGRMECYRSKVGEIALVISRCFAV